MAVLLGGMFLVMVGFGIIIPIMPFYVLHFGATSVHLGLLMATYSTTQFIFAPVWGAVSDRIGRKPVLLIGLAGFVVSFVIFGLSTQLWMLFVARILGGALSSAALPAAMAFISDSTSEENRAGGMAIMGAAMGLGMIFGPAIGGLLSGVSIQTPFFVAAAMGSVNLVIGFFLMPESLKTAWGAAAGAGQETTAVRLRASSRWQLARGPLLLLFLLSFLTSFAMAGLQSTFALYLNARLDYGTTEMGVVFTAMGFVGVIAQGLVVGRLIRRLGEALVLKWGLVLAVVGILAVTRLHDMVTTLAFVGLYSLGNSLLRPAMSSLVSKKSSSGQGAALGAMNSFDSLGRMLGPLWGGVAFYLMWDLPYLTGALALGLGLAAALYWARLLAYAPAAGRTPSAENVTAPLDS
jgi:multidrug resistance protein